MSDDPALKRLKPRFRKRVASVVIFVVACFWLNGPGFRWMAPWIGSQVSKHYGVELDFKIQGRLFSGFTLKQIEVSMPDGALDRLTIDQLTPHYRIGGLVRGEIDGVTAVGVHADLVIKKREGASAGEPLNLNEFGETLRNLRETVVMLQFDVSDVTLRIQGNGIPTTELGKTALRHEAGADGITLSLGAVVVDGREVSSAQVLEMDWQGERFALERIGIHQALVLTNFSLLYPTDGAVFLESLIDVAGARFQLTSSPVEGTMAFHLLEGQLTATQIDEAFGLKIPVEATLTSFLLDVADLDSGTQEFSATLSVLIEDVEMENHSLDELNLDVVLKEDVLQLVARVAVGGEELRVDTKTTVNRKAVSPQVTEGQLEVPALAAWVDEVGEQWGLVHPFPKASADASFRLDWGAGRTVDRATADVRLSPEEDEELSEVQVVADWTPKRLDVEIRADGLTADAVLDLESFGYSGDVTFDQFDSNRHAPWALAAGFEMPGVAKIDGSWSGSGTFGPTGHRGDLQLTQVTWQQESAPDLTFSAGVSYEWPGRIGVETLKLTRDGQSIDGRIFFEDGLVEIQKLTWSDVDEQELAAAHGSLPVPEDFSKWRETLSQDRRPLDLTIRSGSLSFDKLATWLPQLEAIDGKAIAEFELKLTGNYADPILDASFAVRGVRALGNPGLPPADVMLQVNAKDRHIHVAGEITTPDLAPVLLTASMPFEPATWAEDVKTLMASEFEADVVLPRINLARFRGLVPVLSRLEGVVAGNLTARGTLGDPDLDGNMQLTGGLVELANSQVPPLTGIEITVAFERTKAHLRRMRATMAGGTLDVSGTFTFTERELDFRVRGNSLPMVRNQSLIVRTHADVQVSGPFDQAVVSGSISLVDSLFFRDIEILPIGTPFTAPKAAALPKIDTASPTASVPMPFGGWRLNLRVNTSEPLLIRGNLATGRIIGDLRVAGTIADPRPIGTVRLLRGRAVLPFSTLAIPEATLTFTQANGLDPTIEARGTAEPKPYRVNLFAYGRLSDPQIVLSSTPPLPKNEIMTLLATGTTTRGLENPQMASARALQLFAEEVRRGRVPMGNQLRPLLGLLDRVDFTLAEADPYSSDSYSTATLELHERWYLSAGMSEEGNTRMFAIWRLRFR